MRISSQATVGSVGSDVSARCGVLAIAAIAMSFALASCSSTTATSTFGGSIVPPSVSAPHSDPGSLARNRQVALRAQPYAFNYDAVYAAAYDGDVSLPAFDHSKLSGRYKRQVVQFFGPEAAGTIVIDVSGPHLYLVMPGGMAMRYGIAVGKEGFGWTGSARLQWKQKWPTWTPPAQMIERQPELKIYAEGLKGGSDNPLGARAMYLYKGGQDTMYRIHGTTKPYSIGKRASSGCFRMINQDVIDLYDRVRSGANIYVRARVETVFEHDV